MKAKIYSEPMAIAIAKEGLEHPTFAKIYRGFADAAQLLSKEHADEVKLKAVRDDMVSSFESVVDDLERSGSDEEARPLLLRMAVMAVYAAQLCDHDTD